MLSRVFEWYRVVDVNPSSKTVDSRKAAAQEIIKAIDEAKTWEFPLGCIVGITTGFEGFASDSSAVESLVAAIRLHESAFPQDLTENALELRVCAAIAVGEILVRDSKGGGNDANLLGAMLRSGLTARPIPESTHLRQLVVELGAAADEAVAAAGLSRRRRQSALPKLLEGLADPPEPKALLGFIKAAVEEIGEQAAVDREELDILWWMFSGAASTGQPLTAMSNGIAAIHCGAELGSRSLVPPARSAEAMARRAYETGRQPNEQMTVGQVLSSWDENTSRVLLPSDEARTLARDYPALLPLSWLCDRLWTSRGIAAWDAEFERATGIPVNYVRPGADWAVQALRERVAARVYAVATEG